jgi:predicted DNA-binding antitoxin AbrB/MazE fold protein
MVIEAKFENGVFKPIGEVKLEEGTTVEIHINHEKIARKTRPIRELGFAGMWADRDDITDGVSYVNNLRDQARS